MAGLCSFSRVSASGGGGRENARENVSGPYGPFDAPHRHGASEACPPSSQAACTGRSRSPIHLTGRGSAAPAHPVGQRDPRPLDPYLWAQGSPRFPARCSSLVKVTVTPHPGSGDAAARARPSSDTSSRRGLHRGPPSTRTDPATGPCLRCPPEGRGQRVPSAHRRQQICLGRDRQRRAGHRLPSQDPAIKRELSATGRVLGRGPSWSRCRTLCPALVASS
jgi:hypothetical protein